MDLQSRNIHLQLKVFKKKYFALWLRVIGRSNQMCVLVHAGAGIYLTRKFCHQHGLDRGYYVSSSGFSTFPVEREAQQ